MDENDVILWPDGEWCLREDLWEFQWKSDDYTVLPAYSDEANKITDMDAGG